MNVGFTGTRVGMNNAQKEAFTLWIIGLMNDH